MSKTIHGIYRNGRVELLEEPANNIKEGPVLITFLERGEIDLQTRGVLLSRKAGSRRWACMMTTTPQNPSY